MKQSTHSHLVLKLHGDGKTKWDIFLTFCDLLRVSKLDQSRLFLRDFSYCAYRCTMPFHHHWQERDFAAEVVIFFFAKAIGDRHSL